MIGRLTGRVGLGDGEALIVDVAGVGYLVQASSRTAGRLENGREATLLVETRVREDSIALYGFADAAERDWFRHLTGVQGVGGRVALALLSALTPDELATALLAEDRKALTRAEGVGPRLAARIVNELKGKAEMPAAPLASIPGAAGAGGGDELLSALVNLGYGRSEALTAAAAARHSLGEEAAFDDLVRASLRELAG
ncbi:MAG: Holliday junction branch migration protein RuvA [Alphaproteobacteria bacterium]|nr:Holliday junction branch migration protein RuvA [Alphaproteobacteria bacterium]